METNEQKQQEPADENKAALKRGCREFQKIIDLVSRQNPLQKKRLGVFLSRQQSERYWQFAEELSAILNGSLLKEEKDRINGAASYNKMCMDFLKEQIRFRKTGKYRIEDAAIARTEVYNDTTVMRYYMVGLLISYLFWPNHFELYNFFINNLPENEIKSYLEVGVGHGLFTSTMLKKYGGISATIVEISETSISTAKEVFKAFRIDKSKIQFMHQDFLKANLGKNVFEYIIMGEVLEHVNNATAFMEHTKKLLADDGSLYISTAANSPALDHVFHFHNVKEIRDLFHKTGFAIVSDLALPSEDLPKDKWEEELITINYCAILKHA